MSADSNLAFASIAEIGALYRKRKLSPVEVASFLLDRIESFQSRLNAYITVDREGALRAARAAEKAFRGKSRRAAAPLLGIPISLKDNIYTESLRTTGGSQILRDFVPLQDAAVVTLLRAAGAVILGKTNLHEFAYGVTSNNPHFGAVRNPWDLERIAGGSSGGSAAALAAGLCYASIGTDTGGSIRIPAALCGVVGFKPGLGRVSVGGVIPLSTTLDFVGPLARSVADVSLLYETIATLVSGRRRARLSPARGRHPRIGVPRTFFLEAASSEIARAFEEALRSLKKLGARLKDVSLPYLPESEKAGNEIAWAEATHYHQQAGWFPARAAEYGEDVRLRLEMGERVFAVDYLKAMELREKFIAGFHLGLLENEVDLIVAPTTPIVAPRVGEERVLIDGSEHATRALLLRNNRPANLGGIPAITVPCGLTPQGLPVGLQLMAGVNDEPLILEIAARFEKECPASRVPEIASVN